MEEKPLKVSEVNQYIKKLFVSDLILSNISIEGEISNYKHHYSGHRYFSLKDEKGRLKCVMFKNYSKFLNIELKDGMKVVASGYISVYERDGNYQLYVKSIKESGIGDLYTAYEELKNKLEKEGLFKEEYKTKLPYFPKTIGVVTSSTGAAIRDIINVIKRRCPITNIVLYPVLVQGENAPKEICDGLKYLDNRKDIELIITGRGGGSIEELFAFNDEEIARTVFNMKTPVISAVGHETDFTIVDFVSDLRAPTPSAAAELAIPRLESLKENLNNMYKKLLNLFFIIINNECNRLELFKKDLVYNNPINILNENRQSLDQSFKDLNQYVNNKFNNCEVILENMRNKLNLLNPLLSLDRGYSIILNKNNEIINSIKEISRDDYFNIILKDGIVEVRVENLKKGEFLNGF